MRIMIRFLTDVRDYTYINSNYRSSGLSYWSGIISLLLCYFMGFFMLFGIVMPDYLFVYLAKHKSYSSWERYSTIIFLIFICGLVAYGFNKLLTVFADPLPVKEDITPKVFRKKLLSTYFFLFLGFVFMIGCILLFIKYRF